MPLRDKRIWNDVIKAQKGECKLRADWHMDVYKALKKISKADAQILYADLCKLQLCRDGELEPKLHFLDSIVDTQNPEELRHFCAIVIDNGKVVDMVADCVDLTPAERSRKWKQRVRSWSETREVHRAHSELLAKFSAFGVRARTEHEDAYNAVRTALHQPPCAMASPWQQVLLFTPERITRFDKQFWIGFQTSKCTVEETKALCHKLKVCQQLSACPQLIDQHRTRLMHSLFIGEYSAEAERASWCFCRCSSRSTANKRRALRDLCRAESGRPSKWRVIASLRGWRRSGSPFRPVCGRHRCARANASRAPSKTATSKGTKCTGSDAG
tara:strand:- start:1213 stop:2196 length:984 start_codon:yes stop_codon:yes gene_type:complete